MIAPPIFTKEIPQWRRRTADTDLTESALAENPPLWSNKSDPPAIGDRVTVRINNCGTGVVTSYCVYGNYLGVMVLLDEQTRPEWHRRQNPLNQPSLAYGAEILL